LTNLGVPDSGSPDKFPGLNARTQEASLESNEVSKASHGPITINNPLYLDINIQNSASALALAHNMQSATMPLPNMAMAPASSSGPLSRFVNGLSHYPSLNKTSWPPSFRPHAATSGLLSLHQPALNGHLGSAIPLSNATMATDRFSIAERVAAIDRASALVGMPYSVAQSLLPMPHLVDHIPNTKNFPETLFDVISLQEHVHIISWLSHGQGFIIHDKHLFAEMVLPRFFDGAKYTSFTRRLKRWNFVRVSRGPELGAYYNKEFKRDRPDLVQKMIYKMEGQSKEDKKKTKDSNEQEKILKEQIEKEVEAKVQESLPTKDQTQTDKSPRLASQKRKLQEPLHLTSATKFPSPDFEGAQSNESPSLTSPKRIKRPEEGTNPIVKKVAPLETNRNYPAISADSSSLPRSYSQLASLIRSLGQSSNSAKAMDCISMANHPFRNPTAAQRYLHSDRDERVLKAERAFGFAEIPSGYYQGPNIAPSNQELAATKIPGSSRIQETMMDEAAIRDMQNYRLAEVLRGKLGTNYSSGADNLTTEDMPRGDCAAGSGRAVLMSQAEEEEFARYLILKKRKNNLQGSSQA